MSVLTLEVPEKLMESLKAQAEEAEMSIERLAIAALYKQARLDQLREEVQEGVDAIREGRFTRYNTADEMMDYIERQIKERITRRANGNKQ